MHLMRDVQRRRAIDFACCIGCIGHCSIRVDAVASVTSNTVDLSVVVSSSMWLLVISSVVVLQCYGGCSLI